MGVKVPTIFQNYVKNIAGREVSEEEAHEFLQGMDDYYGTEIYRSLYASSGREGNLRAQSGSDR
jgi:hypothetical protein